MEAARGQLVGVRSRSTAGGATLWLARLVAGATAFAAGTLLARAEDPRALVLLAVAGAGAVVAPRWTLVLALLALVAYVPDLMATRSAAHAIIAVLAGGALVRRALGRERFGVPREMLAFLGLVAAYLVATFGAADRPAALAETVDLVSYAAVVALLLVLLDTPVWLRRAAWAFVLGVSLLAVLAIVQQLTQSYGSTYGGFATVLRADDAVRSAGPLNPNPFGQILAAAAVLAVYLARTQAAWAGRVFGVALAAACVVGVAYTQSRAALIALLMVALGMGALCGVRVRVLAVALCGVIALGTTVLPQSLQARVGDLYGAASANAGTPQDTSLRGRKSENLAGLRMWADRPLVGVGPDNYEIHYQRYSEVIGIDPRAEQRGAHNLYFESLAETGVLGAAAFLGLLALSLGGAWRARRRLTGRDALLAEGIVVALAAFLICAITLHSAYARYEWILLGLGLTAGRLGRGARA